MKVLSDKRNLDSLHGKISIGILIVQDFIAIFVLMFMSSLAGNNLVEASSLMTLLSGGLLIVALFMISYLALPLFVKKVAESQELLFLFSICWCFVVAALFNFFGFSIEIGALLAGIALSISKYSIEISSKIKPLRDFFLIIFFIILGLNIQVFHIGYILLNAIFLSLFALLLKPIITMGLMVLAGYTKRTNFLVGTAIAQISEFSLIILALGVSGGQISPEILSTLTLTGVITIAISTYMMIYSDLIYEKLLPVLGLFEKKNIRKNKKLNKDYDSILFGYNRIGFGILESFKRLKKNYLVVDFNPETIDTLSKFRIPCIYGDAYDSDFLKELPLKKLKLAVSTVPDFETNVLLLEHLKEVNPEGIVILRASNIVDALELYEKGASYVLTPHFLGGEYVAKMITEDKNKKQEYLLERERHINLLNELRKRGHEHP
jgi:hypothetical protein